jgi:hypothetical protein
MLVVMAALVAYDRLKGWLQALGEQRMNNKHPIDRAFDLVMWVAVVGFGLFYAWAVFQHWGG